MSRTASGSALLGEEGFPLVRVGSAVADGRAVPVAVETRLAADGHDDRNTGPAVPIERLGVDVPAVEVVTGLHAVEEVQRMRVGPATHELDANGAVHGRRRHLELFDRKARA